MVSSKEHTFQNELAQADEHTVTLIATLKADGRPFYRCWLNGIHGRKEQHFLFQITLILSIDLCMANKQHDGCLQNLIEQIVFGQLVIFASKNLLSRELILYGPRHIDFPSHDGHIFLAVQIFTIQSLL